MADLLLYTDVNPGETIIDLGCGTGLDAILSAGRVRPGGRVIGLDFLPSIVRRAADAAGEADLGTFDALAGDIEAIPLRSASVDHVISNAVLSLCPRKARALAECARVLRPGGKLCIADLVVDEEDLPPEVLTHPAAWAG